MNVTALSPILSNTVVVDSVIITTVQGSKIPQRSKVATVNINFSVLKGDM